MCFAFFGSNSLKKETSLFLVKSINWSRITNSPGFMFSLNEPHAVVPMM